MRTLANITAILLMVQLNVYIATDWWWGARDPFGPYPRIPDKDLVKKLVFAFSNRFYQPDLTALLKINYIMSIIHIILHITLLFRNKQPLAITLNDVDRIVSRKSTRFFEDQSSGKMQPLRFLLAT
ncbi:hypothetical protein ALC62_05984 [Cyphomyrmex costatus]|uniref:Uncharacterized protein n=1 Tax=Cyphomyrmex costatus TaxID=456900 RepID=A0A195CRJ6_9HYME|nr:hypothetical protein ALC62_05984 [Cyphomyrmex costatus]